MFSGFGAILNYSTSIFEDPNDESAALYATVLVGVVNILAVLISSLIVDRIGRRRILLAGLVMIMIINLLIGICFQNSYTTVLRPPAISP